ncbi:hypothetical protein MTO96_047575 [Rhipicephalus appendiculatus]
MRRSGSRTRATNSGAELSARRSHMATARSSPRPFRFIRPDQWEPHAHPAQQQRQQLQRTRRKRRRQQARLHPVGPQCNAFGIRVIHVWQRCG